MDLRLPTYSPKNSKIYWPGRTNYVDHELLSKMRVSLHKDKILYVISWWYFNIRGLYWKQVAAFMLYSYRLTLLHTGRLSQKETIY